MRKKIILSLFLVLIGISLLCITACSNINTEKQYQDFAEAAAQQIISNTLKSPSSAIWNETSYIEDNGQGMYVVYVDVEATNSFGAYIRTKFFVIVKNIDLKNKTYSYSRYFPYIECSGKNDTSSLSILKAGNNYNSSENDNDDDNNNNNNDNDGDSNVDNISPQEMSVTFVALEGGTIQGETSQIIIEGNSATPVTAIPETGYRFVKWEYICNNNTYYLFSPTITPSQKDIGNFSEIEFKAFFEKITYTAKYTCGYGGLLQYEFSSNSGDKNPNNYKSEGVSSAEFLISIDNNFNAPQITAVPNEGYRFVQWSDGTTNPVRQDIDINSDLKITAEFIKVYTFNFTAGEGGTIEGAVSQMIDDGNSTTPVTAIPDLGYRFLRWEYTQYATTHYYWSPTITVSNNDWNYSDQYIAVFEKISYTAKYNVNYSGYSGLLKYNYSPNSGDKNPNNYKPEGVSSAEFLISIDNNFNAPQITAVPNEGYRFVQWSDGSTNPVRQDIDINSDLKITAEFVRTTTMIFKSTEGGSIQGESTQIIDEGYSATPVTAIPNNGYEFVRWEYTNYSSTYYFWSPTIAPAQNDMIISEFKKIEFTAIFKKIT